MPENNLDKITTETIEGLKSEKELYLALQAKLIELAELRKKELDLGVVVVDGYDPIISDLKQQRQILAEALELSEKLKVLQNPQKKE